MTSDAKTVSIWWRHHATPSRNNPQQNANCIHDASNVLHVLPVSSQRSNNTADFTGILSNDLFVDITTIFVFKQRSDYIDCHPF